MKIQNALLLLATAVAFSTLPKAHALELDHKPISGPAGVQNILALPNGATLYVFDIDQPPSSRCTGACAEKWPPVLLTEQEAAGLTSEYGIVLSVITRENGLRQLAVQGRPVYTYFADRTQADALGDGLGGVWHVIKAQQ